MSASVEEYTIAYSETGPVVRHEMKESAETQLVLKSTPEWKRRSPANYIERLEPIWSGWSADRKALEVVVPDL